MLVLKEKAIAAHSALVKKVIIPAENERDLSELPDTIKEVIEFVPVRTMDEVLKIAILPRQKPDFDELIEYGDLHEVAQGSPDPDGAGANSVVKN